MSSTCLIVLGMHRSGTSALAGMLGLLGVDVGSTLIPPHPDINPKGFWENADIVTTHDSIFGVLGSSWNDERSLHDMWWQLPKLRPFQKELMHIVQRDYENSDLWMVKDPRLCRLMPLWSAILERMVDNTKVILIVRNPYEVAESLMRRDGICSERAYLLWLTYMLEAEKWSRGYHRVLISYEQLLSDWRSSVDHIAEALEIPVSYGNSLVQKKIDNFLQSDLRHHVFEGDLEGCRLFELAQSAYQAYLEADDLSHLGTILRPIEEEVSVITGQFSSWSDEIHAHLRVLSEQAEMLSKQNDVLKAQENELSRMKSTISWQITKPMRFMAFLWRKVVGLRR
jgi:hypothetical protein